MRFAWFILLLLIPFNAAALISEGTPGVPYFNHVLFLSKKLMENGQVTWVTLGYGDPRDGGLECNNVIDVFNGRELFRDIPEKTWVLVDYELQSILIQEGFLGDADVFQVVGCKDVKSCCDLRDRLNADPAEMEKRRSQPRPEKTQAARLGGIDEELEVGRQLVKSARCRGCHSIEGFGAGHAPSLTWKRYKYEKGWLDAYLRAPYRMRPGMTDLMMLDFTSPNARPSLQEVEADAVAGYLGRVAWVKSPGERFRDEPFQDYDCYSCHTKLYREEPLAFVPTPIPPAIRKSLDAAGPIRTCLGCHDFGDYSRVTVEPGSPHTQPMAPDLLLAMEKLEANYFVNFVQDPEYLQPGAAMPKLPLDEKQLEQIRAITLKVKQAIADGTVKPVHVHYRMEKREKP